MSLIYAPEKDSYLLSKSLEKIKNKDIKFFEVGVGSSIQLKKAEELGIKNIAGCDINPTAVKQAKKLGFDCIKSNLFQNVKGRFDLIIFNPPYLPEDKGEDKESKTITTGGKDGGELINKFLIQAKKHLTKNGKIFLLTSSLTKGINWKGYKKKKLAEEKLFFEKLFVWQVKPIKK